MLSSGSTMPTLWAMRPTQEM